MSESKFKADYILTMDDIVREGHPLLREQAVPVAVPPGEEERETLECMIQFLKNSQDPEMSAKYKLRSGVGLSANQIGIGKRMFVTYFSDERDEIVELKLINPKIVSHSVSMVYLPESEGCLSVDRPVQGFVPRYEAVKIKATDENGKEFVRKFKGYAAIVMQHELDHLDGIMFYDRINKEHPFKLPQDVPVRSLYDQPGS